MAYNKIVYDGRTLIDLTGDTITSDKVLKNYTFHGKDGTSQTGTCTYDSDTSSATAAVAQILDGKTAYARGAKLTGSMPNNGAVNGIISTVTEQYTIPNGYHDGSGTVGIASTQQQKLRAQNIRAGITILGIQGTMSGSEGVTPQAKTVLASAKEDVIVLPDEGYTHLSQVTVTKIPYVESNNSAGGITVTIG